MVSAVTDHWEVIGVNLASNADATKHLLNKNLICVVRLHGESALTTILLRWRMMYNSLNDVWSDTKAVTIAAANRLFYLPPIGSYSHNALLLDEFPNSESNFDYFIEAWDTAATGENISLDYYAILPDPTILINVGGTQDYVLLTGTRAAMATSAWISGYVFSTKGKAVDLVPDEYNVLMSFQGSATLDPVITYTLSYAGGVHITPRWSIA